MYLFQVHKIALNYNKRFASPQSQEKNSLGTMLLFIYISNEVNEHSLNQNKPTDFKGNN